MITAEELRALGVDANSVKRRKAGGQLHPRYRGVFVIGVAALTMYGEFLAAVKASGSGAVLSHFAAGRLQGIWNGSRARIDVTVPSKRSSRRGIALHETRIPDDERDLVRNIPVTCLARTVYDMAPALDIDRLKRVVNVAERLGAQDGPSLPVLLERYPRRPGAPKIRQILAEGNLGRDVTKRELEARFQRFIRRRRFRPAEVNAPVQLLDGTWIEVDCLWRLERVIVELDSREFHENAEAFEQDRRRDMALTAAGWTVLRVTWRRLHQDGDSLARELAAVLRHVR